MSADESNDRGSLAAGSGDEVTEDSVTEPVSPPGNLSSGQKEQDDLQLLLGLGGIFSTIAEANPARIPTETVEPRETPAPEFEIDAADLQTPIFPAYEDAGSSISNEPAAAAPLEPPVNPESAAGVSGVPPASNEESSAILRNSRLFSQSPNPKSQFAKKAADLWSFTEQAGAGQPLEEPSAVEPAGAEVVEPLLSEQQPANLSELQMEAAAAWFEPGVNEIAPESTPAPLETNNSMETADAVAETADHAGRDLAADKPLPVALDPLPADRPAAALSLPGTGVNSAMEGLVAKLNEQVKKATGKLLAQIEQIHGELESEIKTAVGKHSKTEQKDEGAFQSALSKMFKSLEEGSEEGRVSLSDTAANGRYAIKQLLEGNQATIAQQEKQALEGLLKSCAALASGAEALLSSTASEVDAFTRDRKSELNRLIESLMSRLNSSRQEHVVRLQNRFERFRQRVSAETDLKGSAFEQLVESLSEDLGLLGQRASEKLKLAHHDLENDLKASISIFQLEISLLVKSLSNMQLAPAIHQHNTHLQEVRQRLQEEFREACLERTEKQESAFDTAYLDAGLSQKRQESEGLALLEAQNRQRQVKITEVFNACKTYLADMEARCQENLQSLEEEIASKDARSRKLIDSSAAAPHADLIEMRDRTVAAVKQGQKQASQELLSAIEEHCRNLEGISKTEQAKLTALREKNAQDLKELAKQSLEKIETAVHEAFAAIQLSQQKYLE